MPSTARPIKDRINERVSVTSDGCWLWLGKLQHDGYPQIKVPTGRRPGVNMMTHRVSYELYVGPIPEGYQLDHRCHTRACPGGNTCPHRRCVNPAHLEPVTPLENTRRTPATHFSARTHCNAGHPFSSENTYVAPDGSRRRCRPCARISARAKYWNRSGK